MYTNERVLENAQGAEKLNFAKATYPNSIIIEPCYIGEGVELENSIIGPHVSLGKGSVVKNSIVKNSIIQSETSLNGVILEKAMIGNKVNIYSKADNYSIGDYTSIIND